MLSSFINWQYDLSEGVFVHPHSLKVRYNYVLVLIVKKYLQLDLSFHSMLPILSVTPFEKISLFQSFTDVATDPDTAAATTRRACYETNRILLAAH